jgi:hypothetical protein
VALVARETLRGERSEVLYVVGDYGAALTPGDLEQERVRTADQLRAVGDRYDVVAALAQRRGDPWWELLPQSHAEASVSKALAPHARKSVESGLAGPFIRVR